MELSELFWILPKTRETGNAQVKWARFMLFDLVVHKVDWLRNLGLVWRQIT
jgi:hypothetical protein